jgi:CheY-like chemotaxis protein
MNTSHNSQPFVLYLENNPDDLFFLERQVKKSHACFHLVGVTDIRGALESLNGSSRSKPVVALLDYTLDGGRTGLELLKWIRQQPGLKDLTVIMYSCGELPEIVSSCYREGAHYFIQKCPNLERVRGFVECLDECLRRQPASFEPLLNLREYAQPEVGVAVI